MLLCYAGGTLKITPLTVKSKSKRVATKFQQAAGHNAIIEQSISLQQIYT